MDVHGSDGAKAGSISEVSGGHFVVKKGFFFPNDFYIPTSAVNSVEDNKVYLNVTKDEAMSQDPSWEEQPVGVASTGAAALSGYDTGKTSSGMQDDPEPFEHEQDSSRTHVNEDDHLRVDISEEELTATTRQVERGEVGINKTVVTKEQEIDVPLTEERVNVSRRSVDREATPGVDAFTEGTIEVPVHGEEVDIQKRTRVTGEVDIDKEAVQSTHRVKDTVRREEVTVEGDVIEGSQGAGSRSKRSEKKKNR